MGSHRIMAHILPVHLGQLVMDVVFGLDHEGNLFSPKNGLMLGWAVEPAFDKHQPVIIS